MSWGSSDTIVALSSGRLPAGLAVIRVSGSHSRFILETISGFAPEVGKTSLRTLRGSAGQALDRGLVLFFQGPGSFTGEDIAEFHVHGGKAVAAAIIAELTSYEGVRLAEPGEFTLRAFLNGKLDLVQAEALADLIDAETEAQRKLAVRNASGAQSELYLDWRRQLIQIRAMIEAEIDFSDEGDVSPTSERRRLDEISTLAAIIRSHVDGYRRAEIIRDGYDVAIIGAPNAGKSSLLNALARRDVAIVSDEPGTTRDLVEVAVDLRGFKVKLTDTAGLRETTGNIEQLGIERARAKAVQADLILYLVACNADTYTVEEFPGVEKITLISKADLLPQSHVMDTPFLVSALTGLGITNLLEFLSNRAGDAVGRSSEILPSQLRHVELLTATADCLDQAARNEAPPEIRAELLRQAGYSLGRIAGSVDVEDLLDVIFSRFCIGK